MAAFIGSPAMNLISSVVTIDDGVVTLTFAEHRSRSAPGAIDGETIDPADGRPRRGRR